MKKYFPPFVVIIPRGIRVDYQLECSCTNSCEKVLELLFKDDEKITFEEKQLSFNIPFNTNKISEQSKEMYKEIKNICNFILSNRDFSLPTRLIMLGNKLNNIQKTINGKQPINYNINDTFDECINIEKDSLNTFILQEKIVSFFASNSKSIQKYSEVAKEYFHQGNVTDQYLTVKEHLYKLFPNLDIMFEKVLMNYMLFKQFPFSKQLKTLTDEFSSLCGVYLFIRYLAFGYMANHNSLEDFIDVISASFRLINHTNFNVKVNMILSNENISTLEQLAKLIQE